MDVPFQYNPEPLEYANKKLNMLGDENKHLKKMLAKYKKMNIWKPSAEFLQKFSEILYKGNYRLFVKKLLEHDPVVYNLWNYIDKKVEDTDKLFYLLSNVEYTFRDLEMAAINSMNYEAVKYLHEIYSK